MPQTKTFLVYTDGAFSTVTGGGWAWVAVSKEKQFTDSGYVPPPTTGQRMELTAPARALSSIWEEYGSSEIEITSDSQYLIKGITQPNRARNVNIDLWDELEEAILLHDLVQWQYTKGHSDNPLNNLADKLAVQARKERNVVCSDSQS